MKSVKFVLIILAACAVNIGQICSLRLDNMDTPEDRIALKDPSFPYYSSGILKSQSGISYTANRNKTLILSAPEGYSIFAAVRLLDLRPNNQDYLRLFANQTAGPVTYSNIYSYQKREFDYFESQKSFYAPDGQLQVTFCTGPNPETWGYDGFELLYTVQANLTKCRFEDFWCSNRRCISKSFKCDGHNHCGDRSDQNNCFFPDPIPAPRSGRTAGVVGGVVFLLIAVACAIYIMIRRARVRKTATRRIVNQNPPPTNVQGYPPPYSEEGMIYPPPPPYSPSNKSQGMVNPGYQ